MSNPSAADGPRDDGAPGAAHQLGPSGSRDDEVGARGEPHFGAVEQRPAVVDNLPRGRPITTERFDEFRHEYRRGQLIMHSLLDGLEEICSGGIPADAAKYISELRSVKAQSEFMANRIFSAVDRREHWGARDVARSEVDGTIEEQAKKRFDQWTETWKSQQPASAEDRTSTGDTTIADSTFTSEGNDESTAPSRDIQGGATVTDSTFASECNDESTAPLRNIQFGGGAGMDAGTVATEADAGTVATSVQEDENAKATKQKKKKTVSELKKEVSELKSAQEINDNFLALLVSSHTYLDEENELNYFLGPCDVFTVIIEAICKACTGGITLADHDDAAQLLGEILDLRMTLLPKAKKVVIKRTNARIETRFRSAAVGLSISSTLWAFDDETPSDRAPDAKDPVVLAAGRAAKDCSKHQNVSSKDWTSYVSFDQPMILTKNGIFLAMSRAFFAVGTFDDLVKKMSGARKSNLTEYRPFLNGLFGRPVASINLADVVGVGLVKAAQSDNLDTRKKGLAVSKCLIKEFTNNEDLAPFILQGESVPAPVPFRELSEDEREVFVQGNPKPYLCEKDGNGNYTKTSKDRRRWAVRVIIYQIWCPPVEEVFRIHNVLKDDESLSFALVRVALSRYRDGDMKFCENDQLVHAGSRDPNDESMKAIVAGYKTTVEKTVSDMYEAICDFRGDRIFADVTKYIAEESKDVEVMFSRFFAYLGRSEPIEVASEEEEDEGERVGV